MKNIYFALHFILFLSILPFHSMSPIAKFFSENSISNGIKQTNITIFVWANFFFFERSVWSRSKFDEFFIYTTKMIISHFPLIDYRCKTKNQFFLSFWNLNSLHSTLVYVIFISITSTFPVYMDFGKERVYIQIKSNQICVSEWI